mmetsp:Transcript_29671/g.49183  ORF Transcript_29671/g.49183 Transcript_29671/m.49183 type:complete len:321 (+) Transcript_29671:155-1117(+)|eukprot:CAMPEP_0178823150 /NCGR_PEP_ID=MMETSP0746-20121128/4983_1 /TAXON_ID=913974 /ORGANISM="Nitzschia punctata, Strain CCMP561" /LENGTH=320 /DNA_ID=CAMNT_0020484725 /DNA_START=34 /DNA_END=996 /DNA_ORIENTATION=+
MIRQLWTFALPLLIVVTAGVFVADGFSPIALPTTNHDRSSALLWMARRVGGNDRRKGATVEQKPPMNDEISASELRVVTPTSTGKDEPLGIMSREEALAKAQEMGGLDLILVNPNSDPPVCKIVDYSKYRYMQEKKAKEIKKNSKATEIKEVKMSYKIDIHDYEVRKKSARKFLTQGNRVKCSVMFRGREVQHDKLGFDLLDKLATELEDVCVREGRPKREGRNLAVIISPRPEVLKQVNDNRRAEERAKKKQKLAAKEQKAAAAAAASTTGVAVNSSVSSGIDIDSGDEGNELLDIEADIESSLDDLFGSDDLTDDLFS